jgi:hypothetical protein
MKLLSKILLISALTLSASAQAAVNCQVTGRAGLSPDATCGPNPTLAELKFQGTFNMTEGPIPASALNWGTTKTAIQSQFAANIYANFQANPALNAMFTQMQGMMLARLSTELAANDSAGYTPGILGLAAAQLSAANLSYLRSAFGPTLVNAAAATYAPAAVYSAYLATPAAPAVQYSQYYYALGNARLVELDPADGMFGYDVLLLSYTTKGFGTLASALPLTVRYAQTHIPGNTGTDGVVLCVSVTECIGLALLIYQGGKLVAGAVSGWLTTLNDDAASFASYWNYIQFGPYMLGIGASFPPPSPPPIPAPPVSGTPPYTTVPPLETDPGFDLSPNPSDQGSAQSGGDVSYEPVTF